MASGLGSRNMAMVSRFPKTLSLWLLIMFYCKTMGISRPPPEKCRLLRYSKCRYQIHKSFLEILNKFWLIHEPFSKQKETASCAWKQEEKHKGKTCKAIQYIEYAEKIQQISSPPKCRPVKTVFKPDAMLVF